ncbi:MAG: M48 family metalloprotease [Vulcanimicrobiaceae bacterium]
MRRFLIGACAGFTAAYAAVRFREAWNDLRSPAGPLEKNPRQYGATKRALMVTGFARAVAGHAVAGFALSQRLPRSARETSSPLKVAAWNALGTFAEAVLETPIDYVERFVVERRYGLSDQKAQDWLRDRAKMTLVSIVFGAPIVAGLTAIARRFPRTWPVIASLATPPLLVFLSLIAPVYVAPFFNKFEPLRGTLEDRLRRLAQRYGVGDADIFRFDMSRQTKKANAYVAGVLGTHRIAIADTLLDGFSEDEIEFVIAHELGHYVARDTWTGVAAGSIAVTALLHAANALARRDEEKIATLAGLHRLSFWLQILGAAVGPLVAAGSRWIERRADRFALAATSRPDWGIAAFERLREKNLAEDEQPRWAELLISTHPSLRSRIESLRAAMV